MGLPNYAGTNLIALLVLRMRPFPTIEVWHA